VVAQILSAVLVLAFLAFFVSNSWRQQGAGLTWLAYQPTAGFAIAESAIDYDPANSSAALFW
jgi:hypothetical protein